MSDHQLDSDATHERPPLPRARPAWGTLVFLGAFAVAIVGGYGYAAYTNYEPGTPQRDEVPASVRSSPGGYRSFHFWHSGYHGGK